MQIPLAKQLRFGRGSYHILRVCKLETDSSALSIKSNPQGGGVENPTVWKAIGCTPNGRKCAGTIPVGSTCDVALWNCELSQVEGNDEIGRKKVLYIHIQSESPSCMR